MNRDALNLMRPTPEQCAYAAGLFDAGGFVEIKSPSETSRYWYYRCRICMSDRKTLLAIQTQFRGILYQSKRKNALAHWKPNWVLMFNGQVAVSFYRAIQPYVVAKAKEIKLALIFGSTVRHTRGGGRLSPEHESLRRDVLAKIKDGRIAQ